MPRNLTRTGPNYKSYVKAYKDKEKAMHKQGLTMRDVLFTKSEFEYAYKLEKQKMVKLVKEGKRKVVGNVTQNLVSEQSYEKSLSQARHLKEAYKDLGFDVSIKAIRTGKGTSSEAASALGDKYREFIASGMTSSEAAKLISKIYFGSP